MTDTVVSIPGVHLSVLDGPKDKWAEGQPPPVYEAEGNLHFGNFRNEDMLQLQTYYWPAEGEAVGDVIALHGMGVHARYNYLNHVEYDEQDNPSYHRARIDGSIVQDCVRNGFNFHAFDFQSYGLSEGKKGMRGYFEFYEDLLDDALKFVEKVVANHDTKQLFLMGCSMGGAIATRILELLPNAFTGCILYAPVLSIDRIVRKPSNFILRPIASCLVRAAPTGRIVSSAPNTMFPLEDRYIETDPLCDLAAVRIKIGYELLLFVPRVEEDFSKVQASLLVFHSTNDNNADIEGSEKLVKEASSEDVTFERLETTRSWHSLLHEPVGSEVKQATMQWLFRQVGR